MRHRIRAVMLAAILMVAAACTPQQAIHMTFGNPDAGGNATKERQALNVSWCESEHKSGAVSPTNDHGLFQINKPSWYYRFQQVTGQSWDKVYDPFWNSVFAHWLYQNTGHNWSQWTCRYAA